MSKNLSDKLGKGISPKQFIDGMTQNKQKFLESYDAFAWENDEVKSFFEELHNRDDLRCLIIAADWCGDVVRNIPAVFKALEVSGMPTEVFIQEEHMELMDQFLTMGGRSVPIVIFTDTGGHVLGQWGPRPNHVQEVMVAFKQQNPDRSAPDYDEKIKAVRTEMAARYGEGTAYQHKVVSELRQLLSTF